MDDTSKEYDIGFQQTMQWLKADIKPEQPIPEPAWGDSATDDWYKGSNAAFIHFAEVMSIEQKLSAQKDDLVIHSIACLLTVLSLYLVSLGEDYAERGLGVLILIVARNLFKSIQPTVTSK